MRLVRGCHGRRLLPHHMSSILRKLSVNDRTQAVVYAMRQGWIEMPAE